MNHGIGSLDMQKIMKFHRPHKPWLVALNLAFIVLNIWSVCATFPNGASAIGIVAICLNSMFAYRAWVD